MENTDTKQSFIDHLQFQLDRLREEITRMEQDIIEKKRQEQALIEQIGIN